MPIALERFFLTVLLMMPSTVVLSVSSSVASCLWPISESVVRVTVPYFTFLKNGTKLGLINGRYHMFEDCCMTKEWAMG
jgi:hypothetical protein